MNAEDLMRISMPPRPWSDKPQPSRRKLLWLKEGKKCHWCGRATRLTVEDAPDQATIDHILPRYRGGTNEPENLVSACKGCNGRRNSEDMKGLPDGALLGKSQKAAKKTVKHIALTGDEKRAVLHPTGVDLSKGTPVLGRLPAKQGHMSENEVARQQRDQALQAVLELRTELKRQKEAAAELEQKLKAMTVVKLLRQRLEEWIMGA